MGRRDKYQMNIFSDYPTAIIESNTFSEFLDNNSVPTEGVSYAYGKAWDVFHTHGKDFQVVMCSVSGGSDSDIMVDMIERIGHPYSNVHYVYFNTGMEYQATLDHLEYLENRYGIKIERFRAEMPVPVAVKKFGYPFLSKNVSKYIHRLQENGFQWENKPFNELITQYPSCKAALRWWCNEWGEKSRFNISRRKWLKEFLITYPPTEQISDICCQKAKKETAKNVEKIINADLSCIGVRKAEGGVRASIGSCFNNIPFGCSIFRPVFWIQKRDKKQYERCNDIRHSFCYTEYGLDRTGCACCPFGKYFERELEAAKKYEPKLYKAACNVFGKSYEYTRKYKEFAREMELRHNFN